MFRLLVAGRRACVREPASDEVECDATTGPGAQRAEDAVAVEDRLFPLPKRHGSNFEAFDKLFDRLQQVEIDVVESIEEPEPLRAAKNNRGDSLLDDPRSRAVLRLVDLRTTLALGPHERSHDRGPTQVDGIGEVKDVVEAVVVRIRDVIGDPVAEVDVVASEDDGSLRAA